MSSNRKHAQNILLAVFLLTAIFIIPLPAQAKKVKIQNPLTVRSKNADQYTKDVAERLEVGKIGYLGDKKSVDQMLKKLYSYYKGFNKRSQRLYFKTEQVSPYSMNHYEEYYKKYAAVPTRYRTIGNSYFAAVKSENWAEEDFLYAIKMDTKTYKKRKKYWKQAKKSVKKAGIKNGMSRKKAVKKITKWICKHTRYKLQKNRNSGTGWLFTHGVGQCCDYSDAFWAMCKVCGIPVKDVTGSVGKKAIRKKIGNHAWNRVKIGGKWYWIDICFIDTGKTQKYNLTKKLWKNHIWIKYSQKII